MAGCSNWKYDQLYSKCDKVMSIILNKIFWTVLLILDLCGVITTDSKPVRLLSIIAVICCVIKLTTL